MDIKFLLYQYYNGYYNKYPCLIVFHAYIFHSKVYSFSRCWLNFYFVTVFLCTRIITAYKIDVSHSLDTSENEDKYIFFHLSCSLKYFYFSYSTSLGPLIYWPIFSHSVSFLFSFFSPFNLYSWSTFWHILLILLFHCSFAPDVFNLTWI